MIRYYKNSERSNIAAGLLADGTRGLSSVTAALPELSIAGDYFCHRDNPLTIVPSYFLLDERERAVIGPLFPDTCVTYFVAATLAGARSKNGLCRKIAEVGNDLVTEGFFVNPEAPDLRLVL